MCRDELIIYSVQFIALFALAFFAEFKWQFTRLSQSSFVLLFLSSVILAALSAYIGEMDSIKYLNDAILLRSFLDKNSSLYGLFFLTGGNSLYPQSYFPMLIASNTWSNYTSYTIEKFYLFFSLISKPNLYNVSLFFGVMSFISKGLIIRTFHILDSNPFKLNLLFGFLLIGGLEIFFISGVYKENILLFFLSFMFYTYYSGPRLWKYIVAFLCFLNAVFLRLDTMIIIGLVLLVIHLFYKFKQWGLWRYFIMIILVSIPILVLYFLNYKDYAISKLTRYSKLKQGNTHFDTIDWNGDVFSLFGQILFRWRQAFYSIYTSTDYLYLVCIITTLSFLSIGVLLYYQSRTWHRLTITTTLIFVSFMLIISLFVPNYAALLRYRSPLFIFLMFGLILNIKKKTI
jgi:hypothetical protein